MTQETYRAMHDITPPTGKHCKKEYRVWVMLSPLGVQTEYTIWGFEEAKQSVIGAFQCKITRVCDGRIMQWDR